MLLEREYVDSDFLTDYSLYYSKSYAHRRGRFCRRIHFFRGIGQKELKTAIDQLSIGFWDKVSQGGHYLGFSVVKPISSGPIGRSLFRPYDTDDGAGNSRYFPAVVRNHPRSPIILGAKVPLSSLDYQEQDQGVCACATIALWSTIRKLHSLFGYPRPYSPAEVTAIANEASPGVTRAYPSKGLNLLQMICFLRKAGFESELFETTDEPWQADYLLTVIHAYLRYGLPIICALGLKSSLADDYEDLHAVTMVGYKAPDKCDVSNRATSIAEFYVHDDQVGPFSRTEFQKGTPWLWESEWVTKLGYSECRLLYVLVPVVPEIRQGVTELYALAQDVDAQSYVSAAENYEIFLTDVVQYREELFRTGDKQTRLALTENLPRFMWVLRFYLEGSVCEDWLFDATAHDMQPALSSQPIRYSKA
jgi:hypothetical protein